MTRPRDLAGDGRKDGRLLEGGGGGGSALATTRRAMADYWVCRGRLSGLLDELVAGRVHIEVAMT